MRGCLGWRRWRPGKAGEVPWGGGVVQGPFAIHFVSHCINHCGDYGRCFFGQVLFVHLGMIFYRCKSPHSVIAVACLRVLIGKCSASDRAIASAGLSKLTWNVG